MNINSHIKEWQKFNDLEHLVIKAFLKEYFVSNKTEKDFIAIGFRVIIDVINAIHFFNNLNEDKSGLKSIISYKKEFKRHDFKYRNILFFKVLANINRFRIKKLLKKPKYVSQESFNLNHLIKYNDGGLIYPFSVYGEIIKARKRKVSFDDSFILKISNNICNNISEDIKKIGYKLDNEVSDILQNHFNEFSADYFQLKDKDSFKPFIFSTGNLTAVRLYARLSLGKNNSIESFAHGHNLQNKDLHKLWMDLLISDTYYEQSESLSFELKNYIESLSFFKELHNIKFKHIKKYSKLNFERVEFDLNNVKNVLIIGNATKSYAYSSVTAFNIQTQTAIEESIFTYFNKLEKNIYYKPHPGGHLKKELLEKYSKLKHLHIENQVFEEALEKYDLIVFYYTRTSTITAALNSNKPIMLFDLGIEKHCSSSRQTLEKRCSFKYI